MVKYCYICGKRRATGNHHLIFGHGYRNLADADGLFIPICDNCHTVGISSIHGNGVSEHLSKMLGQALWERNEIAGGVEPSKVRERFVRRYGRSWL